MLQPNKTLYLIPTINCIRFTEQFENLTSFGNASEYILNGSPEHREIWMIRLREVRVVQKFDMK